MATCKKVVELVMSFLDGDLAETDEHELREHLSLCPPCIEFLNTYRKTPELCRSALSSTMPDEMADRLSEFLKTRIGKKR